MGIFGMIHKLKEAGRLSVDQKRLHADIVEWFEANLPNPDFYNESNPKGYVTWFKESAEEMLERMDELRSLVQDVGGCCKRIESDDPGKIVYEDDYQIAVR